MHIHRYSSWSDHEVRVSEFYTGRIVKGLRQIKRCRKCNKLKIRKVFAA